MAMNPRARRRRPAHRGWTAPRPSPAANPRPDGRRPTARRPRAVPEVPSTLEAVLDRFAESWDRGDRPRAEAFLALLSPADSPELIYHEFCLAEAAGLGPDPVEFLRRFPEHADALGRLLALHGALPASALRGWAEPDDLPSAGDEIGPYHLVRELGRGSFARVFLAEQVDLDRRPVVLKVSTRATAEPRLLARARHAHIVEVLRHAVANDGELHLVCMPFLGGATLAAVLERRRATGRRPRSGRDLLADLDAASAPEYPAAGPSRPTREVIDGLSHPGAMAWVVARLAEALDHAHRRGVAHGDLKPSNILLTAEAVPMLFDFNLSVDWHRRDEAGPASDAGGTPAYMAPERLRAVDEGRVGPAGAADLHRADLYALGLVLLEALTGRAPEAPRRGPGGPPAVADAPSRARLGVPGASAGPGRGEVPAGLRSILARCLAPHPADRYARGSELAEDLDHWRSGRRLAHAEEPRRSGLARGARRGRRALAAAALTLAGAVAVAVVATVMLRGSQRERALEKYSTIAGRADSGAFRFRQPGRWRLDDQGVDPAELAARQLARYEVASNPGWRSRDDVRSLPDREREELEAWLLEQVLRLAVALGERPDSPDDWRRALALVEQAVAGSPTAALQEQRRSLRARVGLPAPEPSGDAPRPPRWLDDYLAGVAAEPLHARTAREHYRSALRARPDLFWGHYRAAVASRRIDDNRGAAEHLGHCVARQPGNPALRLQLAGLIYRVERDTLAGDRPDPYARALAECDRAVELDPDFPMAYQVRSQIRKAAGRAEGARDDLARYALLTRRLGRAPEFTLRLALKFHPGPNTLPDSEAVGSLARRALDDDPGDVDTRTTLAAFLASGRRDAEALEQYDLVVEAAPDHLLARFQRAVQLLATDPGAAVAEHAALIEHPRFEELFREEPTALRSYHYVATDRLRRGDLAGAMEVARRGLDQLNRSDSFGLEAIRARERAANQAGFSARGETYYLMARIHAAAASAGRDHLDQAAAWLARSFAVGGGPYEAWFERDRFYDGLRDEIRGRIGEPPSPL